MIGVSRHLALPPETETFSTGAGTTMEIREIETVARRVLGLADAEVNGLGHLHRLGAVDCCLD